MLLSVNNDGRLPLGERKSVASSLSIGNRKPWELEVRFDCKLIRLYVTLN